MVRNGVRRDPGNDRGGSGKVRVVVEQQPIARVKLVRADNAKQNGITIEIEGRPEEIGAIYMQAFQYFSMALVEMAKHDPQNAGK